MLTQKNFWLLLMAGLSLFYLYAATLAWHGQTGHRAVWVAAALLIAHLTEIPLALRALKARHPALPRLLLLTVLYGLLWWVPARRGMFRVN
ncbi:MAG: hypothetical protein ACRETM_05395 [Stenotrophobium sp.]